MRPQEIEARRLLSEINEAFAEPEDCQSGNWPNCPRWRRQECKRHIVCDLLREIDRFLGN
jgi:hypothetical protein